MEFHDSDTAARDLVIVYLCEHGGLTEEQVARGLEVSRPTVSRAKSKYGQGGTRALISGKRGPKAPTKIKAEKARLMVALARQGKRKTEIATRLGVNESTVRKALRRLGWEELAVRQATLPIDEPSEGPAESSVVVERQEEKPASEILEAGAGSQESDGTGTEPETPKDRQESLKDVELPAATSLDVDPDNRAVDRVLARAGLDG